MQARGGEEALREQRLASSVLEGVGATFRGGSGPSKVLTRLRRQGGPQLSLPQETAVAELETLLRSEDGQSEPRVATLRGVTGSGKTLVVAETAARLGRPVLLTCHNKQLAWQTFWTLRAYFPYNVVELLTSPFSVYRPGFFHAESARSPGRENGRQRRVYIPPRVAMDRVAQERRDLALDAMRRSVCPIVVASSAVVFPCAHPKLESRDLRKYPEVLRNMIAGVRRDLARQVSRLKLLRTKRDRWRHTDLEAIVNEDLLKIKTTGWCPELHAKYGAYLPEWSTGTPVDIFQERFGKDWLLVLDESHATLTSLKTPATVSRTRQRRLVREGLCLPSAAEPRVLKLDRLLSMPSAALFVTATPDERRLEELGIEPPRVNLVQRPTHIVDPEIDMQKWSRESCLEMLRSLIATKHRGSQSLVTCNMIWKAEVLAEALGELGLRARYVHSGMSREDRDEAVQGFREGLLDVMVGVNTFREGLDFPRASLLYILDADAGGFTRSAIDLLQFTGRVARNVKGRVVMVYHKHISQPMKECQETTEANRKHQREYNRLHGCEPTPLSGSTPRTQRPQGQDDSELWDIIKDNALANIRSEEELTKAVLMRVRGIGQWRADAIMKLYPTIDDVILAADTGELLKVRLVGPRVSGQVKESAKNMLYRVMLWGCVVKEAREQRERMAQRIEEATVEALAENASTEVSGNSGQWCFTFT